MSEIASREFRGFVPKAIGEEDHLALLAAALDLCPACQKLIAEFAGTSGYTPRQMIRDILWRWLRNWPHATGCPKP